MTTAHRATWKPAKGGDGEQGSFMLHAPASAAAARDAPAHTALKTRAALQGQGKVEKHVQQRGPVRAALRDALAARERAARRARTVAAALQLPAPAHVPGPLGAASAAANAGLDDDVVLEDGNDDDDGNDDKDEESSDDVDDDSEDDDDELRAELARIRAERAAERAAADVAKAAIGNPLLLRLGGESAAGATDDESVAGGSSSAAFGVKRRWDDDVVFKNQARREAKPGVRFINDTIRNDFHRRFLKRYVR
jgi:protein CWC15